VLLIPSTSYILTPASEPIASGAWSSVRHATTTTLPTTLLAVKLPWPPTSRTARAVLAAEAALLTRLHATPGAAGRIVPFRGLDAARGTVVLGLLAGGSLQGLVDGRLARAGPAERDGAVAAMVPWLARQLVGALRWLHDDAGVVHGDIKPANVLLSGPLPAPGSGGLGAGGGGGGACNAVLADFTSAHAITDAPPPVSAGTCAYLAPELARSGRPGSSGSTGSTAGGGGDGGASKEADAAAPASAASAAPADVWALGATILALATGVPPYHGPRGTPAPARRTLLAMVREGNLIARAHSDGLLSDGAGEGVRRALRLVGSALRPRVDERPSPDMWLRLVERYAMCMDGLCADC
jgi:hypothetical protein